MKAEAWRRATRSIMVIVGLIWAVVLLLWWLSHRFPPVQAVTIAVHGAAAISPEQWVELVQQAVTDRPLWQVDVWRLRERLRQPPAVRHVRIERHWPDRLHVDLFVRTPLLRWKNRDDDSVWWLDEDGTFFQDKSDIVAATHVPILVTHAAWRDKGIEVMTMLAPILANFQPWRRFEVSPLGAYAIEFADGSRWELGQVQAPAALVQRVRWLVEQWPKLLQTLPQAPRRIDARYAAAIAVSSGAAPNASAPADERKGKGT